MKPTVLLTAKAFANPERYITALQNREVTPKVVHPPQSLSWWQAYLQASELAHTYDGVLLPGGGDVHPALYGQDIDGTPAEAINLGLDMFELAVVNAFLLKRKPILGICRGHQLINVAFGGTLKQNMSGHGQVADQDGLHPIRLSSTPPTGDFTYGVYQALGSGGDTLEVNTAHHQSIDELGDGLSAFAVSEDGIVEGYGHVSLPVVGIQWHPERHETTRDAVLSTFVRLL